MKLLPKAKSDSFVSNSLYVFIIRFFPTLANFLVLIYYARNLDKVQYGTYQNFWIQLILLSAVACAGIHVFIITYPPTFLAGLIKKLPSKYYLLFIGWMVIMSAVFAGLQYSSMRGAVLIPLLFALVYSLSVIVESFLVVFKSFRILGLINLVYALVFCIIHWMMLQDTFELDTLFLQLLVLSIIRLLLCILIAANNIRKQEVVLPSDGQLISTKIRNMWLHMGFYDVTTRVFSWMDKFIISLLLSKELSAIYFNGSIDIPFLPLVLGATASVSLIHLARTNAEDKSTHSVMLMRYSSRILSAIVFPLFFFLIFFRYELFSVVFSDKYLSAVPIFFISLLIVPLRAYSFTTVLQNQHKGAIINIGNIMDIIIAASLMYPLYKLMGLPGVALSYVISTYCQALFYLYHTSNTIKVPMWQLIPLGNWVLKFIVFFLVFIVTHYLLGMNFATKNVLILGGILLAIVAIIALLIELKSTKDNGKTFSSE